MISMKSGRPVSDSFSGSRRTGVDGETRLHRLKAQLVRAAKQRRLGGDHAVRRAQRAQRVDHHIAAGKALDQVDVNRTRLRLALRRATWEAMVITDPLQKEHHLAVALSAASSPSSELTAAMTGCP
jgi:N-acyl-L-homoserine lactone synthetase